MRSAFRLFIRLSTGFGEYYTKECVINIIAEDDPLSSGANKERPPYLKAAASRFWVYLISVRFRYQLTVRFQDDLVQGILEG